MCVQKSDRCVWNHDAIVESTTTIGRWKATFHATAMKMPKAKMYELEFNKRNAAAKVLEDSKSDVSWGNQIRSYVLDQSRIKDLRTDVEIGDTNKVLDGHLDPFMEASLKAGL